MKGILAMNRIFLTVAAAAVATSLAAPAAAPSR